MGEEISKTDFAPADFAAFSDRLAHETRMLDRHLREGRFSESGYTWGFEVEAWLLDHGYFPNPVNETLLDAIGDDDIVPELSRFNVELNTPARTFEGQPFSDAERSLATMWEQCNRVAHGIDTNLVLIGTLPTIRESDLSMRNVSPLKRYYALNNEVLRKRHGAPLDIDIEGIDHLVTQHENLLLEAAATSFQIHLKVPASVAHRYYNASALVSGAVLAASVNAPLLFDHRLWLETRIPLFEQAVSLGRGPEQPQRVTFGEDYLRRSLTECFTENRDAYSVLLPICFEDSPPEAFRHLRLHNGTIWRWNRPLVAVDANGAAHLRIEHRALPAGPSLVDMIANAALYLGLVHEWVINDRDRGAIDAFATAKGNFYRAARHGLAAELEYGGRRARASEWLQAPMLAQADAGLAALGVDKSDRDRYLSVVAARVACGQTGATWQLSRYDANGGQAYELMAAYCERQRSGLPVHEWDR